MGGRWNKWPVSVSTAESILAGHLLTRLAGCNYANSTFPEPNVLFANSPVPFKWSPL